jgi:glycosyltransferase involved in cell wall biosynthesis
MANWLRAQNTEILHAYNAVGNAWGNLAALLAGIPIFISGEHGSVWRAHSHLYWLNRLAYHRANVVVTNSMASKILVCHRYKVPRQKVKIVYNMVAPPETIDPLKTRSKLGLRNDTVVVGSIGRLASQKGYTVLIDSAREVLKSCKNVKFVLVGGGDQESELTQYVHENGISDNFIFTGWREDARELLNAFDIFVSTSIYEPFGNVFIEAAMLGIPVIAPRVDGIPEAVEDGVTGKLLRPVKIIPDGKNLPINVVIDGELSRPLMLDSVELAHTILEFINNCDLRRKYGEAGRRRAKTMFAPEKYMSEIQNVYSELLG